MNGSAKLVAMLSVGVILCVTGGLTSAQTPVFYKCQGGYMHVRK